MTRHKYSSERLDLEFQRWGQSYRQSATARNLIQFSSPPGRPHGEDKNLPHSAVQPAAAKLPPTPILGSPMAAGPVAAPSSLAVPSARRHRTLPAAASAAAREPPRVAWGSAGAEERARRGKDAEVDDEEAERRRKEEVNRKIASRKALSVILRREATKAVLDKRKPGKGTRRLLPRTVLEALHDRVAALRWDSALKVMFLRRSSNHLLHLRNPDGNVA